MFDDLATMFYNNVVATYDAYVTNRDSDLSGRNSQMRTAIEAATALFHFREHLPAEHAKTRSQVVAECLDYRLVGDVVNAAKHRVLTRDTSEGPPLVNSVGDFEELTVITEYKDDEGNYTDARTVVNVNCSDGECRSLDNALTTVLNYWGGVLKRLNVVDYSPREIPEAHGTRFVSRAEARAANLEAVQGLRWNKAFAFYKFDATKGRSEPVDLTGAEVTFRVFKPAFSVDVTVTPPEGGSPIRCSVCLTEEQSEVLLGLATEVERDEFIRSILIERQEELSWTLEDPPQAQKATEACTDPSDDG